MTELFNEYREYLAVNAETADALADELTELAADGWKLENFTLKDDGSVLAIISRKLDKDTLLEEIASRSS